MLFWFIQMAWNSLGICISSNHWAITICSSIDATMWVHHPNSHFWPLWHFLQQPPFKLLLLSWFPVIVVSLVYDHYQTKILLSYLAGVPTAQHKHMAAGLLWGHLQISSLPLDWFISSFRLRSLGSFHGTWSARPERAVCTSARGDHLSGVQWPRPEWLLARAPHLLGVSASTGMSTVFLSSSPFP